MARYRAVFGQLADALAQPGALSIAGATLPWTAWLASQLPRSPTSTVIVVVASDEAARAVADDIEFFDGAPPRVLPAIDASPYAELSPDRTTIVERLATLAARPRLVVASAIALAQRTMAPDELRSRSRTVRLGETIVRDELIAQLVAAGWTRTPVVDEPGTFAVRGGVIDVFSPLGIHPVRIELFGDAVEALRTFDSESQRTLQPCDSVLLVPVRETIATGASSLRARLRSYADEIVHSSKATRRLIEQLEQGTPFVGIEAMTPAFHDHMVSPADHFSKDARWVIYDPAACRGAIHELWAEGELRFAARRAARALAFPPAAHFAAIDDIAAFTSPHRIELPTLEVMAAPTDHASDRTLRLAIDDLRVLRQQLDHQRAFGDSHDAAALVDAIARWRGDGMRVVIASDAHSRTDRLLGILRARGIEPRTGRFTDSAPANEVAIVTGTLSRGFASPPDRLAVLTASEIFGHRTHHRSSRARRGKAGLLAGIGDFSQLAIGDYVVHQRHGVGRYAGLESLTVATAAQPQPAAARVGVEALKLIYDDGALYLPVYRLGEVQRYVGAEGHAPKLDKLGGATWEATQSKVERAVRVLAEELLQLYAQRASLPGHRFPPADDSFRELEATFPFDETPDQAAAIEAVLADMEAPRAMDRLICGDVGYGKTEVAIRAVFRCIQGGKQACVLAPTTVLVEQHVRTITERLAPFAVEVGKLSRFQSKADQLATIRRLTEGKLDVVIGTHRLLSPDVRFKDLGLLVIDEEQRFGVAHKERIKKVKTQVDVLTLTATPIPRTLHLAMANLRDLSIIATPPTDRRAVRTFVSRVDDATIREAIEAELQRGGQVFFITPTIGAMPVRERDPRVPNQVEDHLAYRSGAPRAPRAPRDDDRTIEEWADYLRQLVPRARVGIGHGSLAAEALEKVMLDFVSGELDVLVATTIVESGLDIPRANTMFVARADAFGLAQLYQLRGRIGRSAARAYCYLLVPEPEHLTDDARRRLETLQRFTELGAGFHIASRDLEIRGGGELLGAKQSGSIAAVGFDHYVRMLDHAVAELAGKPIHRDIDPELTIEHPGFIPDDYVPDPGQRLDLYKRLSAIDDDDQLAEVMGEIADRYGPWPAELVLLGELMGVKAIARALGALALEISSARVAIAIAPDNPHLQAAIAAGFRKLPDGRLSMPPPAPGGAAGARAALVAITG